MLLLHVGDSQRLDPENKLVRQVFDSIPHPVTLLRLHCPCCKIRNSEVRCLVLASWPAPPPPRVPALLLRRRADLRGTRYLRSCLNCAERKSRAAIRPGGEGRGGEGHCLHAGDDTPELRKYGFPLMRSFIEREGKRSTF